MRFAPVYDVREKPRSQRFAADEKGKAVKT